MKTVTIDGTAPAAISPVGRARMSLRLERGVLGAGRAPLQQLGLGDSIMLRAAVVPVADMHDGHRHPDQLGQHVRRQHAPDEPPPRVASADSGCPRAAARSH